MIKIREEIKTKGYAIIKDFVSIYDIESIRHFWLKAFNQATIQRVTWAPYLGQTNHIGFSSDRFQHLYRASDFLWNEPIHALTRDICLKVNRLRNRILNQNEETGTRWIDGRKGVFVTASYYPGGEGLMSAHTDGDVLHGLVPITFRGHDYIGGGMYLYNRTVDRVDVEALLRPGDVVFYDGALSHGVSPIIPGGKSNVGRLQIFPIPATFDKLEENNRAISRIPTGQFIRAKWDMLKNAARKHVGYLPTSR